MYKIYKKTTLFRLGLFMAMTGLLFSRFVLSTGMLLLLINTLINYPLKETFRLFFKDRTLLLLTSLFFLYLLTGIYSEDKIYFLERMRIVLPYLFLPFAFSRKQLISNIEIDRWLCFFMALVFATAIYSAAAILIKYGAVQIVFDDDIHLITPVNHVRYSLMVAFSILIGLHLLRHFYFKYKTGKWLVIIAVIFLVVYLHFIAVRSGIVGLYMALVFAAFRFFFISSKNKRVLYIPPYLYCFRLLLTTGFPASGTR
ncbi:MAG TPA: hypothetical protein ENJ95_19755 [Bacteroidetes bacterium]|nr:hypothetical protein [Bacteroidota bacterium]